MGGGAVTTMMNYPTDLLRELLASEEEAQQAADDHGQHGQDEQPVLLADILHTPPHFIQRHRHPPSTTNSSSWSRLRLCEAPLRQNPPSFSTTQKNPLFSHIEPTVVTAALAKKQTKKQPRDVAGGVGVGGWRAGGRAYGWVDEKGGAGMQNIKPVKNHKSLNKEIISWGQS